MKTIRIIWLSPYIAGRVGFTTRGLTGYPSTEAAQAQIDRFRLTFPANRYSITHD